MTESYPEPAPATPIETLYAEAHDLVDQVMAAENAGDTEKAAKLKSQQDEAFRKAHDMNPLLRDY